jgi:hypothetical protein
MWVGRIVTVHSRGILKIVKSMCNGVEKKIKRTLMKCYTNVNSTPPTQLPHGFSYIVAMLGHNHLLVPIHYHFIWYGFRQTADVFADELLLIRV